jgi:hypothetical protein
MYDSDEDELLNVCVNALQVEIFSAMSSRILAPDI